jgi:hypothetical protein
MMLLTQQCNNASNKGNSSKAKILTIQNNELLAKFEPNITIGNINSFLSGQKYHLRKNIQVNVYDSTLIDTIYNFQSLYDTISIYKTHNKELLLYSSFTSTNCDIGNGIRIGLPANILLEKLNQKIAEYDMITLETYGDVSSTNILKFTIVEHKIAKIIYISIPD